MTQLKRKRRYRITVGGLAFLAVCVLLTLGAFNAGLNMIYLLVCLLISIAILGVVGPLWNTRGLDCRRARSDDAYAGEPFDVDLWVYSRRRTAAHILFFEEPLGKTSDGAHKSVRKFVQSIRPGERLRVSCHIEGRERGVYPIPDLTLGSRFPFGMAERCIVQSSDEQLVVFPARGRLAESVVSAIIPHGIRDGYPSTQGLPGDEFRSVREFRSGDNPRNIHWRVTARRGELVVKEMECERSAPTVLLLDSRLPRSMSKERRGEMKVALDMAVSFAAEVCRSSLTRGGSVRLLAFHPEPKLINIGTTDSQSRRSGHNMGLRALMESLARLKPSDAGDASALMTMLVNEVGAFSRVVAVTPTHETAEGIRSQLAGRSAQIYIADDASMASCFRLLSAEEHAS